MRAFGNTLFLFPKFPLFFDQYVETYSALLTGTKNGNGNTYRYIARDAWEEEEEANGDSQPEHRHLKYDFEASSLTF